MNDISPTPLATEELDPHGWHLTTWLYALLFALSRKRVIRGITVAALQPGRQDRRESLRTVEEALRQVAEHDPLHFGRLRKYVRRIWVGPIPSYARGQWIAPLRMCMLRESYVSAPEMTALHVASILVHESTHAWLDSMEIGYDESVRARVERICIGSQLAFARKHPDGEKLIGQIEERLARDDAWWSNARLRETQLETLQELGTPGWLRRLLDRATRRRAGLPPANG